MEGLSNMYEQQFNGTDSSAMDGFVPNGAISTISTSPMDTTMLEATQSQTLDQIINQNSQELLRRRRTIHPTTRQRQGSAHEHARRSSMMEFGANISGDLADFQFDPNPVQSQAAAQLSNSAMSAQHKLDPRKVRSREELSLDTQFGQMNPTYDTLNSAPAYTSSLIGNNHLSMEPLSAYMPTDVDGRIDFDAMGNTGASMNMSSGTNRTSMYGNSPIIPNFPGSYGSTNNDSSGSLGGPSADNNVMMAMSQSGGSTPSRPVNRHQSQIRRTNMMMPSPLSGMSQTSAMGSMQSPAHAQMPQNGSRRQSMDMQSSYPDNMGNDMNNGEGPVSGAYSRFQSAYSTTGFDMLGVLMRVATRRKPEINIGPVDLSCAFVVCDIAKHDLPIVYCSDMFERLTGYTRYEILGRNCRFLQAPDGKVQSGTKRKYVDDKSILYLKNQISKRAEAQLSLINYRKGGQPFMNLLTMIPITWDDEQYRFFVGFQVDLVEQPNSVSGKNPDGTYEINYNRSALPAYQLPHPDPGSGLQETSQTIPKDEVSQVLATIGNGETDLSKRIWDKVLLENTDDVVHVLSLKGLFLYLSPACKRTLEYEPSELVGTPLSSVCHPSDIVPVTRELKDSSNGATVNVVYRIRRKNNGYTWFEAHGCLHTEQGKGRKCIILVGRQRPVYALDKNEIVNDGTTGDSELWCKISTSGMFLFVSSTSRSMLDRLPDDLVGSSMQSLMRPDSKREFGRCLEMARNGEKITFKHDLQNRRGQVLQAQTSLYPGDAKLGNKPSFLLSQTRLLKMTRAMMLNQQKTGSVSGTPRTDTGAVGSVTPFSHPSPNPGGTPNLLKQTSMSSTSSTFLGDSGIFTQAGGNGLAVGSQDEALASEDNIFDELKTTRSTSWQFELRQMERQNRMLAEELQGLLSRKKKRKRRKGLGQLEKDCANCHTRVTPEWRRGPSGNRDLCNSCGLRWAKQNGRVSPRGKASDKDSTSPAHVPLSAAGNTSKENSAGTSTTPISDQAASGSAAPTQLKAERSTSGGSMPPKIEEGQEPPHPTVLPT